jgi:glycerate dehydrogenase
MSLSATFDRGVVLDLATIDTGDISLAHLAATCRAWTHHRATPADAVAERIAEAQVVVTNKVVLDRARLAATPGLRLVCIAATGTNNVDLAAARELGIAVTNVTGYATPAVVQHVFAGILAHATRMQDYRASVAAGDWSRSGQFCLLDHPIHEIAGRRLGIVGYGELGRAVARVAEAFGMEVLIAQRPGGPPEAGRLPLAELLPRVHVLSLHCPLADNTRGLIGAAELAAMRPDALLINTARGGIVDEAALAEALRRGQIAGALVDVLGTEPPPPDHPLLAPDIPNLTVTPHCAWASREARQRLIDGVAANIAAFAAGRPCARVA